MDDSSSDEQPDIKPETVVTQAAEVQTMNTQEVNAQAMSIQAMNTQVTKVQGMGNEDISQNEGTVYSRRRALRCDSASPRKNMGISGLSSTPRHRTGSNRNIP